MNLEQYLNSIVELFKTKYGIECNSDQAGDDWYIISGFILPCKPGDFPESYQPDFHIELHASYCDEDYLVGDEVDDQDLSKWEISLSYSSSDCSFLDCWKEGTWYNLGEWSTEEIVEDIYEEHLSHVYEEYVTNNSLLAVIKEKCEWLDYIFGTKDIAYLEIEERCDDWDIDNYYELTSLEQVEEVIKNETGFNVSVEKMYKDFNYRLNKVIVIKVVRQNNI